MRLIPRTLKWRAILLTLLGLVAVGGTVGYVWWQPIREYIHNQSAIARLREDPDPLTRALARGEVRAGTSVADLTTTYTPVDVIRSGRYTQFSYPNGLTILAKDGRLAYAIHWGEGAVFFDTMEAGEFSDFLRGYLQDQNTESRLSDAQRDWHRSDTDSSHSAVAGVAGYTSTANWFRERASLPDRP